jgi:hypothetical protein
VVHVTAVLPRVFVTVEEAVAHYPHASSYEQFPSVSFKDGLEGLFHVKPATKAGFRYGVFDHRLPPQWYAIWERQKGTLCKRDVSEIIDTFHRCSSRIGMKHVTVVGSQVDKYLELRAAFDYQLHDELVWAMAEAVKEDCEFWIMRSPHDKHFSILPVNR